MVLAVSEGQLRSLSNPVQSDWSGVTPDYGLRLSPHLHMTYAAIYKSQPAVRTVVAFLARNVAQLGLHVFRRVGDTDRRRVTDHPVAWLLDQPNSTTTGLRFRRSVMGDLGLYDDAYWLILRDPQTGEIVSLRRWPPWLVTPMGPSTEAPQIYRIRGDNGHHLDVEPEGMLHFRGWSPDDERRGSSPIESLRALLAEEHAASQWRGQMWSNGARVTGYIERPIEAPQWSPEAKGRFRAGWQAQYAGQGTQVGGTPILEDGMRFVPAAISPKDAQYVESRTLTRAEVAAAYFIPGPFVGIMEGSNFGSMKEQHRTLYQDTFGPWCAEIESDIKLQLISRMGGATNRMYAEFNIMEKLQGSFEEQANSLNAAIGRPWMTPNEGRARVGLPNIEGGDELLVPLNMGNEGGADNDPEPDTLKPADDDPETTTQEGEQE